MFADRRPAAAGTRRLAPATASSSPSRREPAVQRGGLSARCACGGSCPRCSSAAWRLSQPGDAAEHEAEAAARQVLAGRRVAALRAVAAPAETGAWAAGAGQALDPGHQAQLEQQFGADLGAVRVHTGAAAAQAAAGFGAAAFTAGEHIAFAAGRYAPGSTTGRGLLAHEVAHVLQQRRAPGPAAAGVVQRQTDTTQSPCRLHGPLYGWDNIRNRSRESLAAAGFMFCGPDRGFGDPALWERWVHPQRGVLHFQVAWPDTPDPEPETEPDTEAEPEDPALVAAQATLARLDGLLAEILVLHGDARRLLPGGDPQAKAYCQMRARMQQLVDLTPQAIDSLDGWFEAVQEDNEPALSEIEGRILEFDTVWDRVNPDGALYNGMYIPDAKDFGLCPRLLGTVEPVPSPDDDSEDSAEE